MSGCPGFDPGNVPTPSSRRGDRRLPAMNERLVPKLNKLKVAKDGMMAAIGKARFGDTARTPEGGKGLDGVIERGPDYFNPFLEILEHG